MKKIITFLIVLVGILITPLLLNTLILRPSIWPVVGGQNAETVWVGFWSTYMGAIASFAMVYWTWQTLKQNKEQLNELKRQWDDEHKPEIDIIPVYTMEHSLVVLEVRNISNSYAKNIRFKIGTEYINKIPCLSNKDNGLKDFYNTICDRPFTLLPKERKYFYVISKDFALPEDCPYVTLWNELFTKDQYEAIFAFFKSNPIHIHCQYNESFEKDFLIDIKNAFLGDILL